jgi:hypothetical protein
VVVKDAKGEVLMMGADAVRTRYAKSIADNPNIHYEIRNRIALGEYVIDEEHVTGFTKDGSLKFIRAALVYRLHDNLIQQIYIFS